MKKYIKILILLPLFFGLGCESILEGVNKNPNDPTDAPGELLLLGAELANITVQVSHAQRISAMWSGHYKGLTQLYGSLYNYNLSGEETNSTWANIYQGVVKQCRVIQEKLPNDKLYQGISKILEAHAVGTGAEIFGDVPYSEAANDGIGDPIFDPQSTVFAQLQITLDNAITDLSTFTTTRSLSNDIYYKGNYKKWIEAAYTLKARYYMDTKEYDKAYAAALKGISTSANSMKFLPLGVAGNGDSNLLNTFISERGGYMNTSGTYIMGLLDPIGPSTRNNGKTNEDARFKYYAIGGSSASAEKGVAAKTASMPLVIYEENLLILAEAGARTVDLATGLGHLNTLRTFLASGNAFSKLNAGDILKYDIYDVTDFDSGGVENLDGIAPIRAFLREVVEERYISGFGQFIPFNDARRLRKSDGDIAVPFPFNTPNATQYPERLLYAQDEINSNSNAPSPDPGIYAVTPVNQ